ncbi:phosphonate metabolism transcriptional regulator PhnF [Sulfitobacter donghicola]|uniref:GntR family transcriptional regulator n=1 Tax=Sulfitobacter donghicola DSW-25 = KCTC 12864 = JCM 14565 TaxID=1300350 RepID=A0A073IE95_9RHOB|nr:phosphonate metabolism transcriptional regulator PhnF [Sulfitobacter donghicola]KEJ87890.1 GntR family transcriptional regulator [Sulfitobacter donghicola DSW-25 = KCTC 12864 = JCM 14565]KIN67263.1 Phosphonates metabolism transcriptional regulator PhnF [Sulfitobacter donghicola DSW-25 = KCTC 12864 = JCM 14565]
MTNRTPVWKAIATEIRGEIANGIYREGDKLPTEAVLAARFGVNRHTVRHAMSALADEGLVISRRGAGVFVASTPTDYPIGRRVRFHQNLRAAGRTPAKKVLLLDTRAALEAEHEALHLSEGALVHVYEGLSLAEGRPIALFRSVFPADRFPDLLNHIKEETSVTSALALSGLSDYTRTSTRVNAKLASATQALHLQISEHAPLLRTISINADRDGIPIEVGRTWFAGDKVTLTLSDA